MEDRVILSATDLSYRRGQQYILKQLNWTIQSGENWLVMGQNGCGKTTLLSIFTGFLKPSSGVFQIFGELLSEESFQKLQQNMGFCSSSVYEQVFHNETALEIVLAGAFGSLCYDERVTPILIRRIKSYFRYFHILPILNMPFDMLSKGERQCVLLIRAIIGRPPLILLDEPFSGLDMVRRMKAFAIVRELASDAQTTLVIVTHQPEPLLSTLEYALLMKKGKCIAQGRTEDVFNSEYLSEIFDEPVFVERQDKVYSIHIDECTVINRELLSD